MPTTTEKRTQIYLTADLHRRTKEIALRKGSSMAGVIREALERYLKEEESPGGASWVNDPFLGLIGILELPPRPEDEDINDYIDRIVYDDP